MATAIETLTGPQLAAMQGYLDIPAQPMTPYLGFACNRGMLPNAVASSGSAQQIMVRHLELARADLKMPCPVIPIGWYTNSSGVEIVQAGSYQLTCSTILPNGTIVPRTFGGNPTGTFSGGATVIPDAISLPVPRGAPFVTQYWVNSPNGYVYTNNYAGLAGDAANVGTTTADLTATAMAGSSPGAVGHGPIGIIDTITQRSFLAIGDSLVDGGGADNRDVSGDFGLLTRIVGPTRGVVNAGRSSTTAAQFTSGNRPRTIALAAYASDIICNYGLNDSLALVAAATTGANLRTIRALFPTKRFYQTTITPASTGAWSAVDASDQTATATAAGIIDTLNGLIRLGLVASNAMTITGVLDTRAACEFQPNSQKWLPGYTSDGLHPNVGPAFRVIAARTPGRDHLLW
jgi:lysophospholipase L1-like esterase